MGDIQNGGREMEDKKHPLVKMNNIDKIFYGSYANRNVDFELLSGEVHSILGETVRKDDSDELSRWHLPA